MPSDHLDACFPEIRAHLGHCRFADCTHIAEPDCAVRAAVFAGELSAARYDSYVKLRGELEDTEKKWATFKPGSYDRQKRGR
jgi:ribosome biogenesis GTPase